MTEERLCLLFCDAFFHQGMHDDTAVTTVTWNSYYVPVDVMQFVFFLSALSCILRNVAFANVFA